jgi:hypothetical protein
MRYPLLLALVALSGCADARPVYEELHAATMRLEVPGGVCSGTAVSRNWILTAGHCLADGAKALRANGEHCEVHAIERDQQDHILVRVGGCHFKVTAKLGKAPKVGQAIWFYGNPGDFSDQLRFGRVAGYRDNAMPGMGRAQMLDVTGTFGDSGSGVFNEAGVLVGVVSIGNRSVGFMGMFPIQFTRAQLDRAGL